MLVNHQHATINTFAQHRTMQTIGADKSATPAVGKTEM
jgi:hypothetical protein